MYIVKLTKSGVNIMKFRTKKEAMRFVEQWGWKYDGPEGCGYLEIENTNAPMKRVGTMCPICGVPKLKVSKKAGMCHSCWERSKGEGKYVGRVRPYTRLSKIYIYEKDALWSDSPIAVFDNVKDAMLFANVNRSQVTHVMNGRYKTAGGYVWDFEYAYQTTPEVVNNNLKIKKRGKANGR